MPVYCFEYVADDNEIYHFSIAAETIAQAERALELMAGATYLGERWEPDGYIHQVNQKHLH